MYTTHQKRQSRQCSGLEVSVPEEMKEDAYKMLCEYWGEDFVKEVETEQRTEAFSGAEGESVRTERE